ncbi:MAG: ACT domain-containing protein [Candidatus Kapabacteria bacterium]|jgi:hypothetical protein|nr:ACT domain-containing protein [Candidatus Kapabacteria bacterium]
MHDEEFENLNASTLNDESSQTQHGAILRPEAATESELVNSALEQSESKHSALTPPPSADGAPPESASKASAADRGESPSQATTTFHLLPDVFALVRLPVQIQRLPDFVWQSSFYTISRSPDEISLVCEERLVVLNVDHYSLGNFARIDGNWRILRLGVMDLSLVGVAARFSGVLAEAGVNINIISTYDTDYVMVKQGKLATALQALLGAGYNVVHTSNNV